MAKQWTLRQFKAREIQGMISFDDWNVFMFSCHDSIFLGPNWGNLSCWVRAGKSKLGLQLWRCISPQSAKNPIVISYMLTHYAAKEMESQN